METLRKGKKEMSETKNTVTAIRNPFIGFINIDRTWSNKESVSLKICQLKWKQTNKKPNQNQNIQELWDNKERCNICIIAIPEEEERAEDIFQ